jgi:hypothetical protein
VSGTSRLLARRSLFVRPGRTTLFLLGFALAVAVMIALLSVGEAIVAQARDKDLVGGGDLVLVPQGTDVEVLKLGGVTAMFQAVPHVRFLHRQLLHGPRFSGDVLADAPAWAGRPVYLRARGRTIQSLASASVPSLDRAAGIARVPATWHDTFGEARLARLAGDDLYAEMDHWHRPAPGQGATWAEWYYFNVVDPASGAYAYLSFFVAGDAWSPEGAIGSLSVQLGEPGATPKRYVTPARIDSTAVPLDGVGARLGAATVTFERGRYVLKAHGSFEVALEVTPEPRAYYPPIALEGENGFVSGYVVPAAIARADGTIEAGGRTWRFADAPAYHDHNWGTWDRVHWDWGQVQSADHAFALVYGAVHAPSLAGESGRKFALLTGRDGFLGVLTPRKFTYEGGPVPAAIGFTAANDADSLDVRFTVEDVASSRPRGTSFGAGKTFLQMRGTFEVRGHVAGRAVAFRQRGAAETFVETP